jgi:hypothetical protein
MHTRYAFRKDNEDYLEAYDSNLITCFRGKCMFYYIVHAFCNWRNAEFKTNDAFRIRANLQFILYKAQTCALPDGLLIGLDVAFG